MSKGSSRRNLNRRIGKPLSALHTAVKPFDSTSGDIEVLKRAIAETHQLRDALAYLLPDFQQLLYEFQRNEAVVLRLIQTVAKGKQGLILSSGARQYDVDELLELKGTFNAEFDVLQSLLVLVDTHCLDEKE